MFRHAPLITEGMERGLVSAGHRQQDSRSFSRAQPEPVLESRTKPGAAGMKRGSTSCEEQLRGASGELEDLILSQLPVLVAVVKHSV